MPVDISILKPLCIVFEGSFSLEPLSFFFAVLHSFQQVSSSVFFESARVYILILHDLALGCSVIVSFHVDFIFSRDFHIVPLAWVLPMGPVPVPVNVAVYRHGIPV